MTGTLKRLLEPMDVAEFTADYFGRRRLHVKGERGGFPDVLTLAGFEELLLTLTNPADEGWIRLVRRGNVLPVVPLMLDNRGMLLPSVVFERFAKGYSIVLNHVQRRSLRLRRLCQGLERDLVAATGIGLVSEAFGNLYLSPAENQAFKPHFDAEEVFVLQLSGRKLWALWPQTAQAPVRSVQGLEVDPDKPEEEVLLEPGDLLYLPGGRPHAARTLPDEHSLHLTIGVLPVTAADVLRAAIDGSITLGARLSEVTEEPALNLGAGKAAEIKVDLHRRALVASPASGGVLERLVRPVVAGDRVELIAGAERAVVDNGDDVVVVGRGVRRVFDGDEAEALRRLLAEQALEVGEPLTPALAATLIACGFAAATPVGERAPA